MKKTQKYLAFLLAIVMLAVSLPLAVFAVSTVWDGSIAQGFASGSGSVDDPYLIKTAEQFAFFAQSVNSANSYQDTYIRLESDILLNDTTDWENWGKTDESGNIIAPVNSWTPISSGFTGFFDGNGYAVSGIYINHSDDRQGLFASNKGTIRNLGVIACYISGGSNIGGVVGSNYGVVENCYNSGSINGSGYVGGVIGSGDGAVENCYNMGSVACKGQYGCVGGVIGSGNGTVESCHNTGSVNGSGNYGRVGGIIGSASTVKNCYNTGTISGCSTVGGVAGSCAEIAVNCYNTGEVSCNGNNGSVGGVIGVTAAVTECYNMGTVDCSGNYGYAGGVVGNASAVTRCYNTAAISGSYATVGGVAGFSSETIEACYNIGTVSGNSGVGGVAGSIRGLISNCYNANTVNGRTYVGGIAGSCDGTAENCYNIGTIIGSSYDIGGTFVVGGVTGYVDNGTKVKNCYYLLGCGATDLNEFGMALDGVQLTESDSFSNWNFNKTWEIGYKVDYPYPTLRCFGSREYLYRIIFKDGENILSDQLHSGSDTIMVSALDHAGYDFVYYEDENGGRYYSGDTITLTDDMIYTAAWAVRNTSADVWNGTYDTDWAGGGTEEDPYLISSASELAGLQSKVNNGESFWDKYFKLTVNIKLNDGGENFAYYLTGKNVWIPISGFRGTFDGDNHTVSGLYINTREDYQGLFGRSGGGLIKNLGVIDSYICGGDYVGGVIGSGEVIANCYNTGAIKGGIRVGGVAGDSPIIENCYNSGVVNGRGYDVGGVVGYSYKSVTNCYNAGTVSGSGGVVGSSSGTVTNCYNTGTVSGSGGVVGSSSGTVTNCYNTGMVSGSGGVVGSSSGTVSDCFYLSDCGTNLNEYGTSLSSEQLANRDSYTGWNFNKTWEIGYREEYIYPTLRCFGSREYFYRIVFQDGETILSDKLYRENDTFTVLSLTHAEYDFAYYEDENGDKFYEGDTISFTDDMTYTVAWALRNTSADVWDGTYDTDWTGSGTKTDPYLLTSAAEIAGLQMKVNTGSNYRDIYFKLTADIKMNDGGKSFSYYLVGRNSWTPIGCDVAQSFQGILDGDGHTVSGLYINTREDYQGLFGQSGGSIRNLGVIDSYIGGDNYVGGVIGANYGTLENCYNAGMVNGNSFSGGVIGSSSWGTTVENCYNNGAISGNYAVGGVAGSGSTVVNCHNNGAISGNKAVGGVVGSVTTAKNSFNAGAVKGNNEIGGIAGDASGIVECCYNIGTVSGGSGAGGVAGGNWPTVTNSYYYIACGSNLNAYGVALTEEQMRAAESYVGFDFKNIWEIDPGNERYPYPTLTGVVHVMLFTVSFYDDDGTLLKTQTVMPGEAAFAPDMSGKTTVEGEYVYAFDHWDTDFSSVQQNLTVKAVYKRVKIIRFYGAEIPVTVECGYSREELRVLLESLFARKLFTTTNGYQMSCEVLWSEADLEAIDTRQPGEYCISGLLKITDPRFSALSEYYALVEGERVQVRVTVLPDGQSTEGFDRKNLQVEKNADGTLTVTGYRGAAQDIRIPAYIDGAAVTAISDGAFENRTELRTVCFADTVKTIGAGAFRGCTSLVQAALGDGVRRINAEAFSDTGLVGITLPRSVEKIGNKAFGYGSDGAIDGFTVFAYPDTVGVSYADANGFLLALTEDTRDEATGIIATVENGMLLAAAQVEEGSYYEDAKQLVTEAGQLALFEITLHTAQSPTAQQPDNLMTIRIPVPQGFDGVLCKVYRINSDGSYRDVQASLIDGYLVFSTAHLSYYALVPQVIKAPQAMRITDTSITLEQTEGYEYRCNGGSWQKEPVFENLQPNTKYSFTQRLAAVGETPASGESSETVLRTACCLHTKVTLHPALDSTCITHGHADYTTCDLCDEVIAGSDEPLPLADHIGGIANCRQRAICSICKNEYGELGAHVFVKEAKAENLILPANCVRGAVYCDSCFVCGERGSDPFTFGMSDPNRHTGETYTEDAREASCISEGYTGDLYCASCNGLISKGTGLAKTEHTVSKDWSYDENYHWKACETPGCDAAFEKSAHDKTAVEGMAPDCERGGVSDGWRCSICDGFESGNYLEPLGHLFENGVCRRCGAAAPDQKCDGGANCPGSRFADMPNADNWAHAGIDYAVKNGLFSGMSDTTFEPNTAMTRAMLVRVLWLMTGSPAHNGENPFSDVESSHWFYDGVVWAAENGIVAGMGEGKFAPSEKITREQIAAILYRYSEKFGMDVGKKADLAAFPDAAEVSGWAGEALAWANANGYISGVAEGGTVYLRPKNKATRAQVASILMRYCKDR